MIKDYLSTPVKLNFVNDTIVQTVKLGKLMTGRYETAILWPLGEIEVVRQYRTKAEALKGHREVVSDLR